MAGADTRSNAFEVWGEISMKRISGAKENSLLFAGIDGAPRVGDVRFGMWRELSVFKRFSC